MPVDHQDAARNDRGCAPEKTIRQKATEDRCQVDEAAIDTEDRRGEGRRLHRAEQRFERAAHGRKTCHAFDVAGLEERIDEIQNQQRLHTVLGEALPRLGNRDIAERARMAEETGRAAGRRQLQRLTAAVGNISAGGHGIGGTHD